MRSNHFRLLLASFLALTSTALASTAWYVNGVSGSDSNNCTSATTACKTIGHAISLAASGDSIRVAAATYTENLTVGFSLRILGSGASTTIIDGGGAGTVVTISNTSASVTLSKMTIRHGFTTHRGGGINNYSGGTLTISSSTISGNAAVEGGGIYNRGLLTINNSTLSGNQASGFCGGDSCIGQGGGVSSSTLTLTINNSTVSGNTASVFCPPPHRCAASGGGIAGGTLTVSNSTISGNTAKINGFPGSSKGGGIVAGTATLQNSILANNSAGNCDGSMTSKGYNLSSDNTCDLDSSGDLNGTDPKLGQLGNYGGPTQTIPLLAGSPAIDAGNPSGCTDGNGHLLKTDQRGQPRPDPEDTGGCDMGAYERQSD